MQRKEPDHLLDLDAAKQRFTDALAERIKAFDARGSLAAQAWGFLSTGYGRTGYLRTKDFLKRMNDISHISRTEKLIDLTTEYQQQGTQMKFILKKIVLEICAFSNDHINLVSDELRIERARKFPNDRHPILALANMEMQALDHIYNKITTSDDYGNSYLAVVKERLAQLHQHKKVCVL
jgi:hypothetical protein